jgi:Tfp pilus assembly protein PilN
MKIRINVLPDEQKKNWKTEKKIGAVMRFSSSLVFALLVLATVFFWARIILKSDYEQAKQASQKRFNQSSREIEQTEKFLNDTEIISKKIKNVSGEIPRWSHILAKISEVCPPEVKISLIHAEKEHLKISGFAKTREAFLSFQDKLRTEGFKNMVSPPSNIVSPRDFSFEVELDVDKTYLNQID